MVVRDWKVMTVVDRIINQSIHCSHYYSFYDITHFDIETASTRYVIPTLLILCVELSPPE